jgi:hypothetical protein
MISVGVGAALERSPDSLQKDREEHRVRSVPPAAERTSPVARHLVCPGSARRISGGVHQSW